MDTRNAPCLGGPYDKQRYQAEPNAFVAHDGDGKAVGFYVWDGMDECFRFVSAEEVRSGIVLLDEPFVSDADLALGFERFMAEVGERLSR